MKDYRPINLMRIVGKILEKRLISKKQAHFAQKQICVYEQKGTIDPLQTVVFEIVNALEATQHAFVVSLHIKGAFGNAWWPALFKPLRDHKLLHGFGNCTTWLGHGFLLLLFYI